MKSNTYDKLCRAVYNSAMAFYKEEMWEYYEGDSAVAFNVPGEDIPVIVLIMGQAGEEFGINIFWGENAWDSLCVLLDEEDISPDEVRNNICITGFSIDPLYDIPPEFRSVLNRAKIQARRENRVPFFLTKELHQGIRTPNNSELKMCLWVLKGLLAAHSEDELDPRHPLDSTTLQLITVTGEPNDYSVSYDEYKFSDKTNPKILTLIKVPKKLTKLKQRPERLLVLFCNAPIRVVDDDNIMSLFCVIEESSQIIIEGLLLASSETAEAAQLLLEVLCGKNDGRWIGLPSEMIFANRAVMNHASPHLKPLGVNCIFQAENPIMDSVKENLVDYMYNNNNIEEDNIFR